MSHAQQTLDLEFETAQLSLVQQHELLSHKTECVSDLQYQIAQMQSELRREQTEMEQLQGSLLRNQTSVNHSELELRAAADEHDTMGAIRQALEDEKDMLYRDVSNCESELKSLEAIQNLARDDEF
jgi:chromosome segregation ATPase